MDEGRMHEWINVVLCSWKEMQDLNQPCMQLPILILDVYRMHQMGLVVNPIQSMGIEVIHIPAGCTYLCQPIDVEISKPIKTRLCDKWREWMVEGEVIVDRKAMEPSRKVLAKWVVDIYNKIPVALGRNAWKK